MPPVSLPEPSTRRWPAEWEKQDAALIAWPVHQAIWEPEVPLSVVQGAHALLASQISRYQPVIVVTPMPELTHHQLVVCGAHQPHVHIVELPTDDIWIRDFGPLTVFEQGKPMLLDFVYNGWGGKFPATQDNAITGQLHAQGELGEGKLRSLPTVLEGGSLETDGQGRLLTTTSCLLSTTRNPDLDWESTGALLKQELGVDKVFWLDSGWLDGDDTDGHIDMLARFTPTGTILYTSCDDPTDVHYRPLQTMREELQEIADAEGLSMAPLPIPPTIRAQDGHRLPASYANYLVVNDAVFVPFYGAPQADQTAYDTIRTCFPKRQIVMVDALPLIHQHGSLHCATMQLPAGTLTFL